MTRDEDVKKEEDGDAHMDDAGAPGVPHPNVKREEGEEAAAGGETQGPGFKSGAHAQQQDGPHALGGAQGAGAAASVKTEPSVKGEPGEPPPAGVAGAGKGTVASKGFVGANAGMKSVGALSSAGEGGDVACFV